MHPIIVLEGPDGSGKTTLGQFLADEWGAHYMHLTYRFKDRMFTYHSAALEWALKIAQTKPVIIDRWWPSINIYDDEFRQHRTFPLAHRLLDRAGMHSGVIYVACMPSDHLKFMADFTERKEAGGEMYDSVGGIKRRYDEWYYTMNKRHDVFVYDRFTHGKDLRFTAASIKQRSLQINSRIPHWFQEDRTFGGNAFNGDRKFMIVGERSNPKGRHAAWPFFEYGYSSLWLADVLEEAGVSEYDCIWANALDREGWAKPATMARLVNHVRPQKIIALGDRAHKILWSAGVGNIVDKLPHPAYVKRFQGGDKTEYLNYFKETM